jgi:protein-S-isoprenylcysteine O-methyltransferase Ste14
MESTINETTQQEIKSLLKKIIIRFSLGILILGLLILWPAGTFNYWQFYVTIAVLIVPMLFVLLYFLKKDPMFLERRLRVREKEKQQKRIQLIFTFFFLFGFILSGLDKRFGWSAVPTQIVILVDLLILLSYIMVFFVFKQNSYASRIVEVEKSQKVISTGLYGIIRHPMYTGIIVMYTLLPIALGSYWGLLPMATIPLALVLRILNEEKVLRNELPGYEDYCKKTKYRLIPFLW